MIYILHFRIFLYQRFVRQCMVSFSLFKRQPVQQPGQFVSMDMKYTPGCFFRPFEPVLLEPFLEKTESVSIPIQNLDNITPSIAKSKEMSRKRVKLQLVCDQD